MAGTPRNTSNYYGSINLLTTREGEVPQYLINGQPVSGTINTLIVSDVQDLLDNGTLNGNDIEMNAAYRIEVKNPVISQPVDISPYRLRMEPGSILVGDSSDLSGLTTNNLNGLIVHNKVDLPTNNLIVTVDGGILLDNTGGPVFVLDVAFGILFAQEILTRNATTFIEVDNGLVFTGSSITPGSFISGSVTNLASINSDMAAFTFRGLAPTVTGSGISVAAGLTIDRMEVDDIATGIVGADFIDLDATATITRLFLQNSNVSSLSGDGMKLAGTITDLEWTSVSVNGAQSGVLISGAVGQIRANGVDITAANGDALGLTSSSIDSSSFTQFSLISDLGYGLSGDASSANINNLATFANGVIGGSLGELNGIDFQDVRYVFVSNDDNAGNALQNSRIDADTFLQVDEEVTINTANVFEQILGGNWQSDIANRFTVNSDGQITYVGIRDVDVKITGTLSIEAAAGTDALAARVAVNGTTLAKSQAETENGQATQVLSQALTTIEPNDVIELYVANIDDTTNVDVTIANLIVESRP